MEKFQLSRITSTIRALGIRLFARVQQSAKLKTIVALSVVAAVACSSLVNASIQTKDVTLVVNGKATEVKSYVDTVGQLLRQQEVSVSQEDYVSLAPTAKLQDGLKIEIRQPVTVQFKLGNQLIPVSTTAANVKGFLASLKIDAAALQAVSPSANTVIKDGLVISLNNVKTVIETQKQKIAYTTETRRDTKLVKGKQRVVTQGQYGETIVRVAKQYYNGKLISVQQLYTKRTKAAKTRVVAVGTRKPVAILSASSPSVDDTTRGGINFTYKRVLKNVELSAYDAGFASTKKSPGSAGYGHTASGTLATEGRTIAVDTSVIPMGWWVYIEGVGFRKAEDRGTAINGNEIDVYFSTRYEALQFGRVYGRTVYIIGPNRP